MFLQPVGECFQRRCHPIISTPSGYERADDCGRVLLHDVQIANVRNVAHLGEFVRTVDDYMHYEDDI